MSDAVGWVGAITGSLALSWEILTGVRDRAVLNVRGGLHVAVDSPLVCNIDVTNRGRQPISIVEVGFRHAVPVEIEHQRTGARSETFPSVSQKGAAVLPPGEVLPTALTIPEWPVATFADTPLWLYAIDFRGRTHYGPIITMRLALRHGFNFPPIAGPQRDLPPDAHIFILPPRSAWRVWEWKRAAYRHGVIRAGDGERKFFARPFGRRRAKAWADRTAPQPEATP